MDRNCGFKSFFQGGFECSSHRLRDGRRLDLIASTCHDRFAIQDYQRLQSVGMLTARDSINWCRIETSPYQYDFKSALPLVEASEETGIQIIWDLCHYGWPDDLDLFSSEFIDRFRALASAFARFLNQHVSETPYFCPINEISFFAWAAGEVGYLNPHSRGEGNRLKGQLIRAHIAGLEGIRYQIPHARIVQVDPLIHIIPNEGTGQNEDESAGQRCDAQFHAWESVAGQRNPELGGRPEFLDIVGANYYPYNQWRLHGEHIDRIHPGYRPLHLLLADLYQRLQRPLFIAETGTEDGQRPEWLAYICDEVILALNEGIPIEGICLYPVVNHPGWDDDRHCHNGLWDYCASSGDREIYRPLADELVRQSSRIARAREPANAFA